MNGEKRNAYRLFVGNPEEKRPPGRSRHMWFSNINQNLIEKGWDGLDWIVLVQNKEKWRIHVNVIMNLEVP
jgi:hypothetical protein